MATEALAGKQVQQITQNALLLDLANRVAWLEGEGEDQQNNRPVPNTSCPDQTYRGTEEQTGVLLILPGKGELQVGPHQHLPPWLGWNQRMSVSCQVGIHGNLCGDHGLLGLRTLHGVRAQWDRFEGALHLP